MELADRFFQFVLQQMKRESKTQGADIADIRAHTAFTLLLLFVSKPLRKIAADFGIDPCDNGLLADAFERRMEGPLGVAMREHNPRCPID